jgi:hypothetical protein
MTEHFTVRYDGPALADHTIPVTALAPALLSLSELFNVAHGIASTNATLPPALEVRANREGSFAVDLVLVAKRDGRPLLAPGGGRGGDGLHTPGTRGEGVAVPAAVATPRQ